MSHEFSEAASGEGALLEPDEVFFGEVEDGDAPGRVLFLPEHAEGHVGALDFFDEVAEVVPVDFGEIHGGEVRLAGGRWLARFVE